MNRKQRASGAFDFSSHVIGLELVSGVGLNGNELKDPGIAHSRAVEYDREGAMSAVKVAGIEHQFHAVLLRVVPVKAAVQHIQAKIAVDDQVA